MGAAQPTSVAGRVRAWLDAHGWPDEADNCAAAARIIAPEVEGSLSAVTRALQREGGAPDAAANDDAPQPDEANAAQYSARYDATADTYEIHAGRYHWRDVPGSDVRDWLRWYTHHGAGVTQRDVARLSWRIHRRQLTQRQVRALMRALEVTKSSLPLAPHDLDDPDEGLALVREAREAAIEAQVQATELRDWRRTANKALTRLHKVESIIAEAVATLPPGAPQVGPWRPPSGAPTGNPVTWLVILSDWHIGVDTDAATERLERFVTYWRTRRTWDRRPVERVVVCVAGDLTDGAGGPEMHTGQRTEQDVHGYEQCHRAASLLSTVITELATTCPGVPLDVHCVPGNHDRATAGRNDDPEYIIGRLVHGLAEAWSPGVWHNHPGGKVVPVRVGSGRLLLTHGCKIRQGKGGDVRQLIWSHPDPTAAWTCVVTGHLHEPLMRVDSHVWHVRGGALKAGDDYSRRLGYLARPSQVIVAIDDVRRQIEACPVVLD